MAWIETVVAAILGGGGVRAVDVWLSRREKDREFDRVSKKDEQELAAKLRDELRKHVEMAEARAKRAEEEAKTLRESGKHLALPATIAPEKAQPAPDDKALRELVREEVRLIVKQEVATQFSVFRDSLQKLTAMAEFSLRRAKEYRAELEDRSGVKSKDETG